MWQYAWHFMCHENNTHFILTVSCNNIFYPTFFINHLMADIILTQYQKIKD